MININRRKWKKMTDNKLIQDVLERNHANAKLAIRGAIREKAIEKLESMKADYVYTTKSKE